MKVKFTGYSFLAPIAGTEYFTVDKVYKTVDNPVGFEFFTIPGVVWVVSDDGRIDPMYPDEFEEIE